MASSPASRRTPSSHTATDAARCVDALLESLYDYVEMADASPWDPAPSGRPGATSQHARDTRRLVDELTAHLIAPIDGSSTAPATAALTRRETEVLDALAIGMSTVEIAAVLHISVNTARNHVQRILEKLGAHSRLQAVNLAMRHGLIQRLAG